MPDAPRFNLNEIDNTNAATPLNSGISAVVGPMKWGPIGTNDVLITSVSQFRKMFGGFKSESELDNIALEVERALRRGTSMRVINLKHYNNVATGDTAATLATSAGAKYWNLSAAFANNESASLNFSGGAIYEAVATTATGLNPIAEILAKLQADFPTLIYHTGVSPDKKFFYIMSAPGYTFSWDSPVGAVTFTEISNETHFIAELTASETRAVSQTRPANAAILAITGAQAYKLQVVDPISGIVDLASYTANHTTFTNDTLVDRWNTEINALSFSHGYTSVVAGSTGTRYCAVTARPGLGSSINGTIIELRHDAGSASYGAGVAFAGGVNASLTKTDVFKIEPKYAGAAYNNIQAKLTPSNFYDNRFTLEVWMAGYEDLKETYTNLRVYGGLAVPSDTLRVINETSNFIRISYANLSTFPANQPIKMLPYALGLTNGSDGGSLTGADYAGDSSMKTGIHALDNFTDFWQFTTAVPPYLSNSIPDLQAIYIAASAFATAKKQAVYFAMIPSSVTTKESAAARRLLLTTDTSYTAFYQGGISVSNPDSNGVNKVITLEGWGDLLGLAGFSQRNFSTYASFAGTNRGQLIDLLGVTHTYFNNQADLDYLGSNQINVFAKVAGKIYLNSAFTAQKVTSQLSHLAIRYLLITIRRGLSELLPNFLEEPNDPTTWKQIFNAATDLLDPLIPGRALFNYEWNGDQFVSNLNNLQVNTIEDVQLGKYKVQLKLFAISPLQYLTIDVELAKGSGVSVTENLSQTF